MKRIAFCWKCTHVRAIKMQNNFTHKKDGIRDGKRYEGGGEKTRTEKRIEKLFLKFQWQCIGAINLTLLYIPTVFPGSQRIEGKAVIKVYMRSECLYKCTIFLNWNFSIKFSRQKHNSTNTMTHLKLWKLREESAVFTMQFSCVRSTALRKDILLEFGIRSLSIESRN